jgi:hypothetical protein
VGGFWREVRRVGWAVSVLARLGDVGWLWGRWESIGRPLGERKGSLIIRLGDACPVTRKPVTGGR